jgi:hypothetical protein
MRTPATALIAALALAASAQAQPAPAHATPVSDFIESFSGPFWNTDRRICIWVDGPDQAKVDQVKARVDEDARAAGVSVDRACSRWEAEVEIRFSTDMQRAVDDVLNNHHRPIWPFPMETPTGADRPIKAWYGLKYDFAGGDGGPKNLGSHPNASKKLDLAIVVIDPARTQGLSLDAVADYAALIGLAQPRTLDACNVLPSVTDIFAGTCPGRGVPAGLTAADAAYLKALYTGSAGMRATRYRSELVDRMTRLLG